MIKKIEMNYETKKGCIGRAVFAMWSVHEHPHIDRARWSSLVKPSEGAEIRVRLKVSEWDGVTDLCYTNVGDRNESKEINPGIILRGRDIGAIIADISLTRHGVKTCYFSGGYNNELSQGEKKWLDSQFKNLLIEYAEKYAAEFQVEAIETMKARTVDVVQTMRDDADQLELEAVAMFEQWGMTDKHKATVLRSIESRFSFLVQCIEDSNDSEKSKEWNERADTAYYRIVKELSKKADAIGWSLDISQDLPRFISPAPTHLSYHNADEAIAANFKGVE